MSSGSRQLPSGPMEQVWCQADYAVCVRVILPTAVVALWLGRSSTEPISGSRGQSTCAPRRFRLVITKYVGIIALTRPRSPAHAPIQIQERSQGRRPASSWLSASASGEGHRRDLLRERVLRSSRSGAGQVRDAASGSRGPHTGEPQRGGFRPVSTVLLRGSGGLRRGWPASAAAQEAWAASSAQALPGGRGGANGRCSRKSRS